MTVLAFESPDQSRRLAILSPEQVHQVLIKASTFDGRTVGRADVANWHEIAVEQRWTSLPMAIAAVRDYYGRPAKQGERLWMMPGHVTEYMRVERQQPAPFAEVYAELDGPPPSKNASAHIRRICDDLAARKSVPGEDPAAARAELEETRRRLWAAVDACSRCDDGGMRLDLPDVVCIHEPHEGEVSA